MYLITYQLIILLNLLYTDFESYLKVNAYQGMSFLQMILRFHPYIEY